MRIYQIKNQTPSQMMGYVIVTGNGKVIVIDGGTQGDADALRKIVNEHGGHIDLWFLTHPHIDHHGAFLIISQNPENITVGCVMRSYLPDEFSDYDTNFCNDIKSINAEFKVTPFKTAELTVGDIYNIDNIKIEVLGISNPEITVNAFNNSSCVLKITEQFASGGNFTIMILGDLGVEAGDKLLKLQGDKVRADMVQMAHHGQNGAERRVYEAIGAKYALWPTPDWLWTNTINPAEPGKGPWKTLEVRQWMEALNTKAITCLEETTIIDISDRGVEISGR